MFQVPYVFIENSAQPLLDNEIFEIADFIGCIIAKISNYVKIGILTSLQKIL